MTTNEMRAFADLLDTDALALESSSSSDAIRIYQQANLYRWIADIEDNLVTANKSSLSDAKVR
jgi:hypothetical protein